MIGREFGNLTVAFRDWSVQGGTPYARWECMCSCGRMMTVAERSLIRRDIESCGCPVTLPPYLASTPDRRPKGGRPRSVWLHPRNPDDMQECFESYIHPEPNTGHWYWGGITSGGYGRFFWRGKFYMAQRIAHELFKGPIPEGLVVDHICRTPMCVNPDHLEAVTGGENALRGVGPSAINAAKTECPRGHPFSYENTFVGRLGERRCRICMRARYQAMKCRAA
jgi:hypothetical protein